MQAASQCHYNVLGPLLNNDRLIRLVRATGQSRMGQLLSALRP
jgi:hypothetical protein